MADGRITHLAQQVCWVWQEVPVPVIAAVHGHALGGGMQIALGTDIRIVHPDTQLSVREVHWGLVPDMTGTLFLSRLVGADVAKELVFTARIFDGREAKELGLVNQLVPADQVLEEAMAMAKKIAAYPPMGVIQAKRAMNQSMETALSQGLRFDDAAWIGYRLSEILPIDRDTRQRAAGFARAYAGFDPAEATAAMEEGARLGRGRDADRHQRRAG